MVYEITQRLEALTLNTVVSGFMEYTNKLAAACKEAGGCDKETLDTLAIMLAPFAPHLAEELWEILGHDKSVFLSAKWPSYDKDKMKADTVEIAVQINGKEMCIRDSFSTVEFLEIRYSVKKTLADVKFIFICIN